MMHSSTVETPNGSGSTATSGTGTSRRYAALLFRPAHLARRAARLTGPVFPFAGRRALRTGLRSVHAWAAALAAGLALTLAAMPMSAQAQTQTSVTLVSNHGQSSAWASIDDKDYRTQFTTGSHAGGYRLTGVTVELNQITSSTVAFNVAVGGSSLADTVLTAPASLVNGNNTFTASGNGIDLAANTTYYVWLEVTAQGNGNGFINRTTSDDEDSVVAAGWSITNDGEWRDWNLADWSSTSSLLKFAIKGYAKGQSAPVAPAAPTVSAVPLQPDRLAVRWTAPATTGIIDYDVRYYKGSADPANEADWIEAGETGGHDHAGTLTQATITGLDPVSTYRVQVRATNAGGISAWSASGSGRTEAPVGAWGSSMQELVGNTGKAVGGNRPLASFDVAQGFRSAGHGLGYTVTDVDVLFGTAPDAGVRVTLATGLSSSSAGTTLATLRNPAALTAGVNTFTAPAGTTLDANTTYHVVVEGAAGSLSWTTSNAEAGLLGWRINNSVHTRVASSTGGWTGSGVASLIRVNGRENVGDPPGAPAAPTVTAVTGSTGVTVGWSAPAHTGSGITDYDVRYYEGSADPANEADWVEEDETTGLPDTFTADASTSLTITGLKASTAYRVQVRAESHGAPGPWSPSSSVTTNAGTGTNNAPTLAKLAAVAANGCIADTGNNSRGALTVTGGRLVDAKRTVRGENRSVTVRVRPSQSGALTLALAAPTDCSAADAVCASDGRKLSAAVSASVPGPDTPQVTVPVLSVADARADEGGSLAFAVTLSEAAAGDVTVDYATSDGTANAGADYTAASGTLTFAAGETAKTVSVALLHDGSAENDETVTLTLSNPSGATIGDGEAIGTVADVAPLTASFHGLPEEHDGRKLFAFEVRFSEEFQGLRLTAFKAGALQVTGGRVIDAKRTVRGQNRSVTVKVRPSSTDDMTITLPAVTDCAAASAICTHDGRKLSRTVTATVRGPVAVSVADAEAQEGADAAVSFAVTLSRAASREVAVDYATRDGTATAGEDYTFTRGTLTFAQGETEKTVEVPILDDALDEGSETFTLKLTGARGAAIADGEATGTIKNSDPLQTMWLSRFGRTVADHVTAAVSDRLANPLTGAQVTVGGQTMNLAELEDEAWLGRTLTSIAQVMGAPSGPASGGDPGSGSLDAGDALGLGDAPTATSAPGRLMTGRELLLGSAFHLAKEGDGATPGLAAWGRVTVGGFDGEAPADAGNVRIDGDVTTGIIGTDAEWNRVLAGVAVSVSEGEGRFDQPGVDSGTIESTMTTVNPYARLSVNERLSVWGLAGYGTGDMTIVQDARTVTDSQGNTVNKPRMVTKTDLSMRLAALGGRGALLTADGDGGMDLALKADGFFVETTSEAISNEGDTTADASRVRLALEGSRAFQAGDGVFTPGLELGLRHDGGDAETGTGVELGGRLSWADAGSGLSMDLNARTLIAHEDSNYREWGASGAVRLAPGERGRGLSFSLAPTYGVPGSGVDRLWSAQDARGLAPTGGAFEPESRLEGELGYGMGLFGDRFTGTPNLGFGLSGAGARDYRIGWRLTSMIRGDAGFEVTLDATRSEPANDNGAGAAQHGIGLRLAARW